MFSSPVPCQLFRFLALSTCILVPLSAIAQSQPTPGVGTPGCGPADMRFEVRTSKYQNPPNKADAGKAFLQDDTNFNSRPRPSTLVGLDGQWIGATNGNSYFYFSVDPGERPRPERCTSRRKQAVFIISARKTSTFRRSISTRGWSKSTAMRGNCWSANFRLARHTRRSRVSRSNAKVANTEANARADGLGRPPLHRHPRNRRTDTARSSWGPYPSAVKLTASAPAKFCRCYSDLRKSKIACLSPADRALNL
jgi:hypothetical protein